MLSTPGRRQDARGQPAQQLPVPGVWTPEIFQHWPPKGGPESALQRHLRAWKMHVRIETWVHERHQIKSRALFTCFLQIFRHPCLGKPAGFCFEQGHKEQISFV